MTTMDALRQDLDLARGRWPAIAESTGIDYFTICRIARGETMNPRIDTVEKIRSWLDEHGTTKAA